MRKGANRSLPWQPRRWRGRKRPLQTISRGQTAVRPEDKKGWQYFRSSLRMLASGGLLWAAAALLGRVAGGAVRAAVFAAGAQPYSLALWAGSYLVEAVPGIILHLALVPALVLVLTRTGLIPRRYPQGKALA